MQSLVALALMAKLSRVFAAEQNFLSFPLAPVSLEPDDLAHFGRLATTGDQLRRWGGLSRMLDLAPSGAVWPPGNERRVSEAYRAALTSARLARVTRTPEEETRLRAAMDLLAGPARAIYLGFRADWFDLQQRLRNARAGAQLTTDPAEKQQLEAQVAELATDVALLEARWLTEGNREVIEAAQSTVVELGRRSPEIVRAEWLSLVDQSAFPNDDLGLPYALTALSPPNVWDSPWMRFTLRGAEVKTLANEAPPELVARIADQWSPSIDRLEFEATTVSVVRPWLAREFLESRFWRLPDTDRPLSDGERLDQGSMPAYVSALVLARGVTLTLNATDVNAADAQRIRLAGQVNLAGLRLAVAEQQPQPGKMMMMAASPAMLHGGPAKATAMPAAAALRTGGGWATARIGAVSVMRVQPAMTLARPAPALMRAEVKKPAALSAPLKARLNGLTFHRRLQEQPTPTPTPAPTTQTLTDGAQVIAFICARVPKCPNPDPALSW